MFDENSLFPLVLRGATKQNTTEITCLFIFLFCFPSTRKEEDQERRHSGKSLFVSCSTFFFFFFNLKHRALVFFWKPPYFIINILYPGCPLSSVMANQHTQATAVHSNYSNQSN